MADISDTSTDRSRDNSAAINRTIPTSMLVDTSDHGLWKLFMGRHTGGIRLVSLPLPASRNRDLNRYYEPVALSPRQSRSCDSVNVRGKQ